MYGEGQQTAQYGGAKQAEAMNRGMLGAAGDAARQLEVPAELERLAKAVEYVDHSLNELANRMEGKVLRPVAPQPTGDGKNLVSVGPSTGYGQELRQRSDRLNAVAEGLQDIIRRLEV